MFVPRFLGDGVGFTPTGKTGGSHSGYSRGMSDDPDVIRRVDELAAALDSVRGSLSQIPGCTGHGIGLAQGSTRRAPALETEATPLGSCDQCNFRFIRGSEGRTPNVR